MLYYRDKKVWKKLLTNTMKGIVLIGAAAWLSVAQGTAPVQNGKSDVVLARSAFALSNKTGTEPAVSEGAANVFGPAATYGPIPQNLPMAGPPEPAPVDSTTACGSFTEPAQGVLTSGFGARWGRSHTGIDIGGDHGSDVLAADGGKVIVAGWVSGYGNYVVIDHENSYQTAYGHCDELLVEEGERVAQGQKIALMGNTGNSTGTHLHFEVKVGGTYQDPLDYVLY